MPDLNGRYTGTLQSNYNNSTTKCCAFEIKQTASKITVFSYYGDDKNAQTSNSQSISGTEVIINRDDGFFDLVYIHDNTPASLSGLSGHKGYVKLSFRDTISGEYYNFDRDTKGIITLSFEDKKLTGKL